MSEQLPPAGFAVEWPEVETVPRPQRNNFEEDSYQRSFFRFESYVEESKPAMTEPSHRDLRWMVLTGILVFVLGLLAALYTFVQRSDSVVDEATHRLQPGMTIAEVQQILKGVHHANIVTKGRGMYLFYGNCEWVTVNIENDRVVGVECLPDVSPWRRMRLNWHRSLRFVFARDE